MKEDIRKKLDEKNNFHLSLKVIQITDNELLKLVNKIFDNSYVIDESKDIVEQLEECYNKQVSFVLCNENIDCLLPLVVVITKDITSIIKVKIPVIYKLKDNKIIQKVKTRCNQLDVPYLSVKDNEALIENIKDIIYE